jgi:2-oxoglutarate ferredoxin oxidoreductase subunit alpha
MNYGQMVREVERVVAGRVPVALLGHGGGSVHTPEQVLEAIVSLAPVAEATR